MYVCMYVCGLQLQMIYSRYLIRLIGCCSSVVFVFLILIQWSEKIWQPRGVTDTRVPNPLTNTQIHTPPVQTDSLQETMLMSSTQRTNEEKKMASHYFKYRPTNTLYSLTYGCPGCKNPCKTFSVSQEISCRGKDCLNDCSSPIFNHKVLSDNTYLIKTKLLDAEKLMLDDEQITEKTRLPDITKFKLELLNEIFNVGEMIKLKMVIYDSGGKLLKRGGDDVRVSLVQNKKRIAGRFTDYNNGTYLVTVPALWNGSSTINVVIPYYREEGSTLFRWFRTFNSMFYHYGYYSKDRLQQATLCMTGPNITGYSKVCNVSAHNGGQPWFCGHPKSKDLSCKDFSGTGDYRFTDIGVTDSEMKLFRRECTHADRVRHLEVKVKGTEIIQKSNIPLCKDLGPAQTWDLSSPTGYFTESNYFSTKCRILAQTRDQSTRCLQNTNLLLTGDSTTLQWYKALRKFSSCKQINTRWFGGKWYQKVTCVNKEWNFTLKWAPHAMPFSFFDVQKTAINETSKRSLTDILNGIPNKGRNIFVLHIYAHYTRVRYHIFRDKVKTILPALREALKRNKELQVVVKSPHVYYCVGWVPCVNDFMGRHLITILHQEMKEFVNQIKYLDYWDMSVSAMNAHMHADDDFIWKMVQLMIDHTCKL